MELAVPVTNPVEARIAEAFAIFDYHGDNYIDTRNVGHVLRFIGCVPTEEEVNEVIVHTESAENPGETHLSKFLPHVLNLLMERKMEPLPPEKLLEQFKILDPENKHFLTKEYFGKLMAEEGEPFNEEELETMWPVAIDPITGNIPYEFYISKLMHVTTIFDEAEAYKEELAATEKERKKDAKMHRIQQSIPHI